MGFHPNLFAEQTGLSYDKGSRNFWGTQDGYPVFVRYVQGRSSLVFLLYGRQPEEKNISAELNDWRTARAGISGLTYRKNCLSCIIALAAKDTDLNAVNHFDAMVKLARELMLTPCCMSCGTEYGLSEYVLDGTGVSLCPACAQATRQRLGDVQLEKQSEPVSHAGAAVSTVIGAAFLFLITFLVLKLGYVSYLTGYIGVLVTFLLIKKLGKKLTPLWGVIAMLVCGCVAFAVPVVEFASDIAKFNQEEQADAQKYVESYDTIFRELTADQIAAFAADGKFDEAQAKKNYDRCRTVLTHQTTGECVRDMTDLLGLETYSSVKGELIKCILWGVLSILIGGAITLPGMLNEASGKHDLRELTAG